VGGGRTGKEGSNEEKLITILVSSVAGKKPEIAKKNKTKRLSEWVGR